MPPCFDHEKLLVYRDAIKFVVWATSLLEDIPKNFSVWDQLDRASASIPLNIAEGNGKVTVPARCSFFDTARGSALESSACLDVLMAKELTSETDSQAGKEILRGVVSMLVGLIRSSSPERLYEDQVEYRAEGEQSPGKDLLNGSKTARIFFDHERLEVYQESIRFIACTAKTLEQFPRKLSLWGKLDRASTSIPLNIAEGNGKFTGADRCRFFDNARSAALGCAACLDALAATKNLAEADANSSKAVLRGIVSMLVGLIRSNSADRAHEEMVEYRVAGRGGD